MILNHPLPALLALCPWWLACRRLGRGAFVSRCAGHICRCTSTLARMILDSKTKWEGQTILTEAAQCSGEMCRIRKAPAVGGTTPDLSARFFAFMSSVTLRSPLVTVSPYSGTATNPSHLHDQGLEHISFRANSRVCTIYNPPVKKHLQRSLPAASCHIRELKVFAARLVELGEERAHAGSSRLLGRILHEAARPSRRHWRWRWPWGASLWGRTARADCLRCWCPCSPKHTQILHQQSIDCLLHQ